MTTPEIFDALHIEHDAATGAITLTSPDMTGNGDDIVRLHPAQARRIGELAGVDDTSARELRRLRRRLVLIDTQAERLAHWLATISDSDHADLTRENLMAGALADLTADAVADFEGDEPEGEPAAPPSPTSKARAAMPAMPAQGSLL